jgi:hypothetical protein
MSLFSDHPISSAPFAVNGFAFPITAITRDYGDSQPAQFTRSFSRLISGRAEVRTSPRPRRKLKKTIVFIC